MRQDRIVIGKPSCPADLLNPGERSNPKAREYLALSLSLLMKNVIAFHLLFLDCQYILL